jgi:diguanylate cyclase (GGDEF)-like protein
MACWVAAEIAWARAERDVAAAQLAKATEIAVQVQHEPLACFCLLLASQVFELQGKHQQALVTLRGLKRREQLIRSDSLKGRERTVDLQWVARQSAQRIQTLEATSKQFEQWSLEDALTGLANRRNFEQKLSVQLRAAAESFKPVSVALFDIDRFKSINDQFGHQVGDKVLQAVSTIFVAHIREDNMPARLGGDEFVVMFAFKETHAAGLICKRIQTAVRNFDWESIAVGLSVTLSFGVGQAVEGESVESLLHRSDMSMYRSKPLTSRAPV